jgi:hypothetical protein
VSVVRASEQVVVHVHVHRDGADEDTGEDPLTWTSPRGRGSRVWPPLTGSLTSWDGHYGRVLRPPPPPPSRWAAYRRLARFVPGLRGLATTLAFLALLRWPRSFL